MIFPGAPRPRAINFWPAKGLAENFNSQDGHAELMNSVASTEPRPARGSSSRAVKLAPPGPARTALGPLERRRLPGPNKPPSRRTLKIARGLDAQEGMEIPITLPHASVHHFTYVAGTPSASPKPAPPRPRASARRRSSTACTCHCRRGTAGDPPAGHM